MVARIVLTILVWLLGGVFQLLDGQVFRSALIGCGCAVACTLLWLPLVRSCVLPVRRRGALIAVLLHVAIAASIATSLPDALEIQRAFNRRSWALAYLRSHPEADPMEMIRDYNASDFGKRQGYFSLDEARAMVRLRARRTSR